MSTLELRIVSPEGELAELECDSVHMIMPDDSTGHGGGSIGIRHGHQDAIIALAAGNVEAYMDEKKIFSQEIEGGFAIVKDNKVKVLIDKNFHPDELKKYEQ